VDGGDRPWWPAQPFMRRQHSPCSPSNGDQRKRCSSPRWSSLRGSLGLKLDRDRESAEETPTARLGAARRETMQVTGGDGGSRG
jgi:hypothetical protein